MNHLSRRIKLATPLSAICLALCALPAGAGTTANTAPGVVATGSGKLVIAPEAYSSTGKAVFVLSSGKLLVAANSQPNSTTKDVALTRLNPTGTLDTTFGGGTGVAVMPNTTGRTIQIYSATLQSDGKVVGAGVAFDGSYTNVDFAVMRFNADGSPDTTFGTNGITITDMGSASDFGIGVAVDSSGRIIVGGQHLVSTSVYDFAVARYTSAGVLDTTFSGDGKAFVSITGATNSQFAAMTVQSDDKIILAGTAGFSSYSHFGLARLDTSGALDSTFGTGGMATTDVGSTSSTPGNAPCDVRVDASGNILAVGEANNANSGGGWDVAMVRYTSAGVLDTTFNSTGKVITAISGVDASQGNTLTVLPSGKLLVTGYVATLGFNDNDFLVMRYNSDGSLDTTFSDDGIATINLGYWGENTWGPTAVQSDGKVVVTGTVSNSDGATSMVGLARMTTDGTLDAAFVNLMYTLGGSGTPVTLNAQAQDYELSDVANGFTSDNYNGSTLTLARQGGANALDVFSALTGGTLDSIAGSGTLTVDGTAIGTFTQSTGTLTMYFGAASTTTLVNRVMQQIAYANSGTTAGSVKLLWSFNDGNVSAQGTGGALVGTAVSTVYLLEAGSTVVSLASFTAQGQDGQVKLAWTTGSEVDAAGFNLWRSATAGGTYSQLNATLLPATGISPAGASYAWTDATATAGATWYYKLEDLDTAGQSTFHGPVSATLGTASALLSFQASPASLFLGGSSLLSWTVGGAPALFLNGLALGGNSVRVAPATTTAYTLSDALGDQRLVTVTVKAFGLADMAGLSKAWGSGKGEAAFDPCYDLNGDDKVDDTDVSLCFQGL